MTPSTDASDHERAAIQAFLRGDDDECASRWEAAHRTALAAGHLDEAARYAFWLGFLLLAGGQTARANGWFVRSGSLIAHTVTECRASGYLLIPQSLGALEASDPQRAQALGARAAEIGDRFHDADLRAFGRLCHGQALIAAGEPDAGMAKLDEVMLWAAAGELGAIVTGIAYCAVILECVALFDLKRAAEWTGELSGWCDAQSGLVPFRGQCLVHRSQLQQAEGDWPGAVESALQACARLADPPHPALGLAHYQLGEMRRLRGDLDGAEHSYRDAGRHGCDPVPGVALLELARGDGTAASATILRALAESGLSVSRPALLSAAVEIHRANGDITAAHQASDELSAIAMRSSSELLTAMADQAAGSVQMEYGKVPAALKALRAAATAFRAAHMPYDVARTAVLLGLACAAMGDQSSAGVEFSTAKILFGELAATPDLNRVERLLVGLAADVGRGDPSTTLSARELEVLAHIAAGRTNREIAGRLVVSPHTVARHVEHIYAKLGVANRAAATAYAYEHHLV
ncbi:helix-turn-helix domain-containing protein [Mycolicibacterium stellerae]|uniref:helix-turn-helix domain-containing protein n=1 Tax=Mycolicibacterium stellerae TaxID=2358193 RepID=UPI000F0B4FB9|nr:helix-turn-helix transcriptional regulator [Mycolicibacterium stellerae]